MKSVIAVSLAFAISISPSFAQEAKQDEYNTIREFKNRVFSVEHREPRTIAAAVKLLGSGFKGAGMTVNDELKTITVRDYPENIAAIEEAIKRLDRAAPKSPEVEIKLSVLIGSKTPLAAAVVPDDLGPVVKQLQSTLSFTHYGLMTATVHRTKPGVGIEGSGVAEPTLLGMAAVQERPIVYSFHLRSITLGPAPERSSVDIGNVAFSMRVPLELGNSVQYQSVGFETPVSLRQGEKVVIGTTTMRDKVLIVVVTANVNP